MTTAKRRKGWRRRAKDFFLRTMAREDAPGQIALSFAVGVGISLSPLLGFHTLIAILVAWTFPLKKVDVILGSMILVNPWTMVPIYTAATALGWVLLGRPLETLPPIPWRQLVSLDGPLDIFRTEHWIRLHHAMRPYLGAFVMGTSIFAIVGGLVTYFSLIQLVQRYRLRRADRAIRRAERRSQRLADLAAAELKADRDRG